MAPAHGRGEEMGTVCEDCSQGGAARPHAAPNLHKGRDRVIAREIPNPEFSGRWRDGTNDDFALTVTRRGPWVRVDGSFGMELRIDGPEASVTYNEFARGSKTSIRDTTWRMSAGREGRWSP